MSKLSPGNWKTTAAVGHIVTDDPSVGPNDEHRVYYGGGLICESIANPADAHAMAAAKELMEACQEALDVMGFPDPSMEGSLGKTLRAALAKAKGGAP